MSHEPNDDKGERRVGPIAVSDFVEALVERGVIPDAAQIHRVVIDANYHGQELVEIHVLMFADQNLPACVADLLDNGKQTAVIPGHVWRCPRCFRESQLLAGRCTGCNREGLYVDIDITTFSFQQGQQQSYGLHLCTDCLVCACGFRRGHQLPPGTDAGGDQVEGRT